MNDDREDKCADRDPAIDTLVLLRLLIALMGEEIGDYAEADPAPQPVRALVREASLSGLRGVLIEVVSEMSRRQAASAGGTDAGGG